MATNIFGYCDPKFAKVENVFRKLFNDGWEFEGASFSAYHKGKLVVDLKGGYSDSSSNAKWKDNTRTMIFSSSKAVGAICMAIAVDRGYCKYEEKVSKYWPNFAKNGKENTTILHIVNHQAGLPIFYVDISIEECKDPDFIAEAIENQTPLWEPGTKYGYHAITYGWLVDQIIRRVDPEKRGIGQFFNEEIAQKYARDLAKLFSLMIRGDLISKDLVKRFYEPLIKEKNVAFNYGNGHGFMYEPHPKKPEKWLVGHPGYGGNNVMVDPEEEIVVAYITNGIKAGAGDMVIPYRLLRNAVFDSLVKFPKENVTDRTLENAAPPMLS
uniref:Beta-lactamase-related domain-containing protein n=1 Tax=Acrobeloides nanus TaxID=290746 RepID=A0A914E732_9BILA